MTRQGSSGSIAGHRIASPLPVVGSRLGPQTRASQLQVPSRASGGRIPGVAMPRSRPTSGSSARAVASQGAGDVVNEALDAFMRKVVDEEQRLEEERLNEKENQQHRSVLEESGQTCGVEDPHGREVAAKFAAKFSDERLSLSKPLFARDEEAKKGDSFQHLIAQIERLDSPEKRSRMPDKQNSNDESTGSSWGVAAFPSGSGWDAMAPPADLTDSWAGERTAEPTSSAMYPESPSCGETAALERALMMGDGH